MFTNHAIPHIGAEQDSQCRTTATEAQAQYEYHFVKTYGWYENNCKLYIAMEYMALGDLQSQLDNKGPFEETDAKFISKQILRGLEFMHGEGFVHRDLKPANLLIKQMPPDGTWWIKMSDFGVSKKIEHSLRSSSTVCGTPGFMAPELLGYSTPGTQLPQLGKWKAADIWAFGETVYRLLTGTSSFVDDFHLGEYFRDEKNFPWKALKRNNVSADGIEFIRCCMAPCPIDRPSANDALEQLKWPITHVKNENWTAKTTRKLRCKGKQAPFILFTPQGEHLIIIEEKKIIIWNIELQIIVSCHEGDDDTNFCHGSIRPDGKYLCVTQTTQQNPLILQNAIDVKHHFTIDDFLHGAERHPSISAFAPGGQTLVTARDDVLCQIDIKNGWKAANQYCVAGDPESNGDESDNRIRELRFMEDGSQLMAAGHTRVVVMNTATNHWFKMNVIDYPCLGSPSGLDISSRGLMLACGSITGELWLRTSEMRCWVRVMMPSGGPGVTSEPVENVRFSTTGRSVLYNLRGRSGLMGCRTVPLDKVSSAYIMSNHPGQQLGQSLRNGHTGATALGGRRGRSVVFWEAELRPGEVDIFPADMCTGLHH